MAKVNQVALCPGCGHELPIPLPPQCPKCGRVLEGWKSSLFGSPDYLSFQIDELKTQIEKGPFRNDTDRLLSEISKIEVEARLYARGCPAEDKKQALGDALLIMENLIHSRTYGADLEEIVFTAMRIGRLAAALDQYIKARGKHHDPQVGQIHPDARNAGRGEEAID